MKKIILITFAVAALLSSCGSNGKKSETSDAKEVTQLENNNAKTFTMIKEGSNIAWRASHLGGVKHRFGKVNLQTAKFSVSGKQLTNAEILINMKSLTVENFGDDTKSKNKLTTHLLSKDFFDTEKFSTSKFELVSTEAIKEGDFNTKVTGNLTILDATKSITFNANVSVSDSEISIKSEDFSVDRSDWGLVYHAEGSEGVPVDYLIADDIGFTIDAIITK